MKHEICKDSDFSSFPQLLPSFHSLVSNIFINTLAMKNLTPTLLFPKGKIPNFTFERKGRCTKKSIEIGDPF